MLTLVSFSSISFDIAGITRVIECAKPSHGSGSDGIPPVLYCTARPDLHPLFLNQFSLSVSCVTSLPQWKTSVVVSQFKNGSLAEPENVCLNNYTPILSRLMGKVV